MGLSLADIEKPSSDVWECNLLAYQCFQANQTQWRSAGMGGVLGMDYGPCYSWCYDRDITGKERAKLIDDLRYLESGAMQGMQDARENSK